MVSDQPRGESLPRDLPPGMDVLSFQRGVRVAGLPVDFFLKFSEPWELDALTDEPGDERRIVTVDTILAGPAGWADSSERHEPDWAVHDLGGLIVARRITG